MFTLIILSVICIPLFYLLLSFYIKFAINNKFIDKPENISVHKKNTPTGAGIIIVITLIIFYLLLKFEIFSISKTFIFPNREYLLFISILMLGFINFYDDIKHIHPIYRLATHFTMVMISLPLFAYYMEPNYYNFLPLKILTMFTIFFWVYLINIYNFIDGSNGYLTINSLQVFFSFCLIAIEKNFLGFNFYLSFLMILFLLVFLLFNFPKAKIFIGDSGSVTIGYIVGYLFFVLFFQGNWHIALALVAYPLMDVSITILRKMKNGHNPWERLFDYFFLRALTSINYNHKKIFYISLGYNLLNVIIIGAMIVSDIKTFLLLSLMLSVVKLYIFNKMKSYK